MSRSAARASARRWASLALLVLGAWILPELGGAEDRVSIFSVLDTQGRVAAAGSEQSGSLTDRDLLAPDGSPLQVWSLDVQHGAAIQVELVSDAFDEVLFVVGPGLGRGLYGDYTEVPERNTW